jgi:hypothetical protein
MLSMMVIAVVAASPEYVVTARPATEAPVAQSRTFRLTASAMFALAERADAQGDSATVSAVYAALEQNPDADVRAEARFRHAKRFMAQNQNRDAAVLLRRILDEKPGATGVRLELAALLHQLGEDESALRHLRAAQAGHLPLSMSRMIDRYAASLRATRPAGFDFEIAIAPDSNISRATRSDTLGTVLGDFDIGRDSQARSGTGLALRTDAFRRIALGRDHSIVLRAAGSADLYRRREFNDIVLDFAAAPEFHLGPRTVGVEAGVTQRWYGQKPFVRSVRLGGSITQPLGSRTQLRLSVTGALLDNRLNDLQDGKSYSVQGSLEHALSQTTGLAFSLGGERLSARDSGYSTTGWRAGLLAWHDIGRATVTAQAEYGRLRADERLSLFPDKRSDKLSRLTIGATFRQLTFGGFAPVTRLIVERNKSSIEFYDYKRVRSEFGIARAF